MCFTKNEDKMSAQLLDGKSLAKEIKENLKKIDTIVRGGFFL